MGLAARIGLSVVLIGTAAESARAQRALFEWLDLNQIERSEIEVREEAWDPPAVREGETFLSPRNAPPSPDASLGRPLARLGLDAEGFRLLPTAPSGIALRVALPLVDLTVAGYPVRMAMTEVRADPDFDALHYTLLATESDDYARLTISRTGPEVIGTVFIDDKEFRILPEDDDYQLVYPVVAHVRAWRREKPADLATRAGRLEARHLQIGWVADQRPGTFDTHADGRPHVYADGPTLGKLHFWSALEFDAAGNGEVDESILKQEVEIYLNSLPHFTWISDPIEVRIDQLDSLDLTRISIDGLTVQVSQLIYGIPLSEPLALRMVPSGDVMQFDGTLARYDMAPPSQGERILNPEARARSAIALRETYGVEVDEEVVDEDLFYDVLGGESLQLIWRIDRKADCGMIFRVHVDAVTGEAIQMNLIDNAGVQGRSTQDIVWQCRFGSSRFRQQ